MSKIERMGITYSQTTFQIPIDLKGEAQELGINLTQAAVDGIRAAVNKARDVEEAAKEA